VRPLDLILRGKREAWTRFRTRLFVGIVLVVLALTSIGLFLVRQEAAKEAETARQKDFQTGLADMRRARDLRTAALLERCKDLVQRPRIHAALEDNALDVLYPTSHDEFQEIMRGENSSATPSQAPALKANFYRFLDSHGHVLSPPQDVDAGQLTSSEEANLSLPNIPERPQFGALVKSNANGSTIDEIVELPVLSTETGDLIAGLVMGFDSNPVGPSRASETLQSGTFIDHHLNLPGLPSTAANQLETPLSNLSIPPHGNRDGAQVEIGGTAYLAAYEQTNRGSLYPPVYDVTIYPLALSLAREERLQWQILLAGALLMACGLLASRFLATLFATRVEKLEIHSRENWTKRRRAEEALETTSGELQRAARFSSDASHQLKTPLTVLRAGLEEIVVRNDIPSDVREDVSGLVHQTFRLTSIVEDLLLLSRMDARRLQITMGSVDLGEILERLVDDLTAIPEPLKVRIEKSCPHLQVAGERRYIALILQNLFENARKYNCPGGEIRIDCRRDGEFAVVVVGNTGREIPSVAREHIFERFHRGTAAENIPGHGLGLNLARELARLHGGEVCLKSSDENWTEFEVRFRIYKTDLAANS